MTEKTTQMLSPTEVEMLAEIQRLRVALKGPDGFATWQEAFHAERLARVRAEQELLSLQVNGQVGGMDGWVLLDLAMQCAERAPDGHSPIIDEGGGGGALSIQPAKWVIDAMRAAIRWDRRMNRDDGVRQAA